MIHYWPSFSCPVNEAVQVFIKCCIAELVKSDFFCKRRYLIQASVSISFRVTRLSEDHCQIEVMLILSSMTEEEVKTELKCVAQNRGGRQEAVAQLRLEGDFAFGYFWCRS